MASNSSALIVPAPPAATNDVPVTADIRDLKPLADIPDPWFWACVAAGLLAAALVGWLLWRWWKTSQAKAAQPVFVPPHVRARQRLNRALDLIADAKPFCTEVSDTVRVYLEEQFNLRAPERTTEEFLRELQGSWLLSNAQKKLLGDFLEQCDLVKFARFEPMQTELESLHRSACQLVEETQPNTAPIPNPPQAALSGQEPSP